jgi:hypothetical protein
MYVVVVILVAALEVVQPGLKIVERYERVVHEDVRLDLVDRQHGIRQALTPRLGPGAALFTFDPLGRPVVLVLSVGSLAR